MMYRSGLHTCCVAAAASRAAHLLLSLANSAASCCWPCCSCRNRHKLSGSSSTAWLPRYNPVLLNPQQFKHSPVAQIQPGAAEPAADRHCSHAHWCTACQYTAAWPAAAAETDSTLLVTTFENSRAIATIADKLLASCYGACTESCVAFVQSEVHNVNIALQKTWILSMFVQVATTTHAS